MRSVVLAVLLLTCAPRVWAQELHVMTSGAFTAAFLEIAPQFEQTAHMKVTTAFGASMGGAPDSFPSRLDRGEPADVVILAREALDDLVKRGRVVSGSQVDLVRSSIAMAVRAGAPKPDISSVDGFSAGIATGSRNVEAAQALIRFLSSAAVAPVITRTRLEPVAVR